MAGWFVGTSNKTIFHSHFHYMFSSPKPYRQSFETESFVDLKKVAPIKPLKIDIVAGEYKCMAKTIYFEAGNQSYEGKLAVGVVVMNRVKDKKYPNSVCGVIKQYKQFSWYWDGKSNEPFKNDPAWDESIQAAEEVLYDHDAVSVFLDDSSVQFYHADYVNPWWAKKMERVAKIDNHIFYR